MPPLHAVILAGGPGRRFWPWSTPETPKHALPLLPGGGTLFGETVRRLRRLAPPERLWLVTTAAQVRTLRKIASSLRSDRILVEPEARDTAAAIGLAALRIHAKDPEAVMAVCPADHAISPSAAFIRQMRQAAAFAARRDALITFGLKPTCPATTYGYIEAGERLEGPFRRVAAFHEKPPLARARRYFREKGRYLWNSGAFVWKASVLLAALGRHAPALRRGLERLGTGLAGYRRLPRISIDYAVMERAGNAVVLPAAFRLEDWGVWTAWEASLRPDAEGNRRFGNARLDACRDTTAVGADPARPLVVSGAEGLLVVQAPAGALVCRRDRAADLKKLLP